MTEEKQKPKQQALEKWPEIPMVSGGLMPRNYPELIEFSKMVAYSGMVPKGYEGNPGAVMVAVQMGAELGLTPMTSIRSICVINGRPCLWGDAMLALVVSSPKCEDVTEKLDGGTATCTVKRKGRTPITRSFSWEDAKRARLDQKKGPWQEYPKRMLQMRARGFALRDAFPDTLSGIYSREEVDDIDMGAPEFVAGPNHNPLADVPPEGVDQYGPEPTSPQEAEESTQARESIPEPAPPPPAPEEGAQARSTGGKYDDVGPEPWADEPEQGKLDGAGF